MPDAKLVTEDELFDLTVDARIVAIRWDVLDWGLVLDMDVPQTEESDPLINRAWLAFCGVHEFTLPLDHSRLPRGIQCTSGVGVTSRDAAFTTYAFRVLLSKFDQHQKPAAPAGVLVQVSAQSLVAVMSVDARRSGDLGLSYSARVALCSDEAMMALIR